MYTVSVLHFSLFHIQSAAIRHLPSLLNFPFWSLWSCLYWSCSWKSISPTVHRYRTVWSGKARTRGKTWKRKVFGITTMHGHSLWTRFGDWCEQLDGWRTMTRERTWRSWLGGKSSSSSSRQTRQSKMKQYQSEFPDLPRFFECHKMGTGTTEC